MSSLPVLYVTLLDSKDSSFGNSLSPRSVFLRNVTYTPFKITLQNILVHRSWPLEWSPPPPSGPLDPCQFSSNNWKLISFNTTWLKKNFHFFQNIHLYLSLSLLLLLACIYLNNAWDLVLWALLLSVCLFKINRFMYSPIVSHFG